MTFPANFMWGAAAASYQIEGAAGDDGRGPSVWDAFCRQPDAVWNGQSGAVACDHYHRYREDVALMREIGLHGYRLSTSWPRVLPEGVGKVNHKGMEFYDRLFDELLKAGITPFVTLFHWDYPYALYCKGGWLNRDSADWFADYTRVMIDAFSDRVTHWITQNEPQCFIGMGHQSGVHAPGLKLGWPDVLLAAHHAMLAHGKAVQVIRAHAKRPCQVGYAPVGSIKMPAGDNPADVEAARQAMFATPEKSVWNHAWWLDPLFLGCYPPDMQETFAGDMPVFADGDLKTICQPLDFFGFNTYSGTPIRAGVHGAPEVVPFADGHPMTAFHWAMTPEALYWGARFFYERYHLPIYVTENGMANLDWVAPDGRVHDPQRIDFTTRYLREFGRAAQDGIDIRGYFHWSILDNFEWAEGYKMRFGLIHVDYPTGKRTLKDSAYWYKEVIKSNGASLSQPASVRG